MRLHGADIGIRSVFLFSDDGPHRIEAEKTERHDELKKLSLILNGFVGVEDVIFYEEPPLAGRRNIRTLIGLTQVTGMMLSGVARCYPVPVATWKKEVVGNGNATKQYVEEWLFNNHPTMYQQCVDQNEIDAACLYLYGVDVVSRLSFPHELA